jgi:hypothetical protein
LSTDMNELAMLPVNRRSRITYLDQVLDSAENKPRSC